MKQRTTKKNKLEKDLEKPTVSLNELKETAVNTPTQEDYLELMRVYECGGWNWASGGLPQGINYWRINKEKTCINAQNKFGFGTAGINFKEKKVISTQQFYDKQNVTPEMLEEINNYFETITKK